jgi:hypothetical protein
MKKSILLLMLIFPVISLYPQIPNAGFETWGSVEPGSWRTTNMGIVPYSITPTIDSYVDSLAVRGEVVSYNGKPFPPYLGVPGSGAYGFTITQPHDFFQGWYKASLLPGDRIFCQIVVYDGVSAPSGIGIAYIDSNTTGWLPFYINIAYNTPAGAYAGIFFTITDSTGNSSGQVGSFFIIDDLSMTGMVNITEIKNDDFLVYPSPSDGTVNIHLNTDHNFDELIVSDLHGRIIYQQKINSGIHDIILDDLPASVYLLQLKSRLHFTTRKFIVK